MSPHAHTYSQYTCALRTALLEYMLSRAADRRAELVRDNIRELVKPVVAAILRGVWLARRALIHISRLMCNCGPCAYTYAQATTDTRRNLQGLPSQTRSRSPRLTASRKNVRMMTRLHERRPDLAGSRASRPGGECCVVGVP